ncbi:MAG: MBL fold metallo-hydrolase [Chitinophagales bacterium]|nr:MBL fold metallo-hydrolase [Chitinophagales bacterium]
MIAAYHFVFNDFLENTYILSDESGECIIIDPGCYYENEREDLKKFIVGKNLHPVLLLLTHAHIDHILGVKWVKETFNIPLMMNKDELFLFNNAGTIAKMYGLHADPPPAPDKFLQEGDQIKFGNSFLQAIFTPGHSPASMSFLAEKENFIISGDVLFQSSIGRTDLPGGDYETLMQSIFNKLLVLPEETVVYSGHGPATNIGEEKRTNPFILEFAETVRKL